LLLPVQVNPQINCAILVLTVAGWVCYAEKTHGEYVLPYISTTKSPQQIMGTVVKHFFSKQLGVR